MSVAIAVTSGLLAAALAFSAIRKLSHDGEVVEGYRRAGVAEDKLDLLAGILLAGAAGLLLGLLWAPLAIATAAAVVVYFLVAIAFHIRAGDAVHLPTPLALVLVAAAVLVLRLAS